MTRDTHNIEEMDKETLDSIKIELKERRAQILNDLELIVKEDDTQTDGIKTVFPEYGNKSDENAQEISEYTTNIATEKVLQDTLRDIDATLERIEKGKYGICKYCGKPINKKRLIARPVASACVECKTKLQNQ